MYEVLHEKSDMVRIRLEANKHIHEGMSLDDWKALADLVARRDEAIDLSRDNAKQLVAEGLGAGRELPPPGWAMTIYSYRNTEETHLITFHLFNLSGTYQLGVIAQRA